MRINREEIFGPVASVIRVKDYDEALAAANDTPFGLSAGIATTILKHATHFKRHSQAGMVMVNLPTAGVDYHVPFGGRKGSQLRSARAGPLRAGVLHRREDGLHRPELIRSESHGTGHRTAGRPGDRHGAHRARAGRARSARCWCWTTA